MSERINKTSICSVVFLDIVDYSKMSVSDQSDLKEHFNALINEAIKDVAQNDRILLDTGDGAAISLMGAPEEALFVSMTIRDSILAHNKQFPDMQLFVRIGINLGPVRVVSDINGLPNIIGDGINVAQRVMSFAEPNQILVSRSYYEVTSRLTKEITGMFTYSGIKHDKHVREHEVYVIRPTVEETVAGVSVAPAVDTQAAAVADAKPLSKTGWVVLVLLLVSGVASALYWTSLKRPAEPEVQMAEPVAPTMESIPAPVIESPTPAPAAVESKKVEGPKKTEEPKKPKRKKTSTDDSNKGTKPADAAHTQGSAKAGRSDSNHSTTPVPVESQPQQEEKSGWDSFKDSVKKGGKRECTQGEIALNQCKP